MVLTNLSPLELSADKRDLRTKSVSSEVPLGFPLSVLILLSGSDRIQFPQTSYQLIQNLPLLPEQA